ncbi:MAG: preprotein translocase subunit SecE [Bacteroidales bacterium]|jgi:preprotein translocase subunit SecE|nr:preprotein translocase subunit SecE [Bacteroidales bacterium]
MSNKVVAYVKSCYDELMNKVSWPTMAELQNSTIVVFVASLIIALIVFIMDITCGVHPTMFWKGLLGYLYQMMA